MPITFGIRQKLALAFGLLMALVLLVAAAGIDGLRQVNASYDAAINRGLQLERLAAEMRHELLQARQAEQQFLLRAPADGFKVAEAKYARPVRAHVARLGQTMQQLEARLPAAPATGYERIGDDLVALRPYVRVYGEDFDSIVESLGSGAPPAELNRRLAELASSVVVVEPLVADIANEGRRHASAAIADAQSAGRRSELLVAAGTAAACLAGLLFAVLLGAQIARPLRELAATAVTLGAGDLSARAVVTTQDETGTLATKLNTMADRIGHALRELQRSEENYRGIYENSPVGIYRGSMDGRPLSANPALARMLGFASPAQLVDRLASGVQQVYVHPRQREGLIDLLRQGHPVSGAEIEVYRQDGQRLWVSITARIAHDPDGAPLYTEAIVTDITEQRRADAEREARRVAEAANVAKSRFLASMSHELRTPLNAIMGFAQVLQLDPARKPAELEQLGLIHKSGEHLLALIDDILDLAKIEAGKLDLAPREVQL